MPGRVYPPPVGLEFRPRLTALLALSTVLASCSKETKRCHELMTSAQGIVNDVKSTELASVEQSLGAIELALDACDKAGRTGEKDELQRARNQLFAQVEYLKKKASRPAAKKRTPEEVAALVKSGDPDCPKGQAYRPNGEKQEIKCTGPQIVEFDAKRVESYFGGQGYKISKSESPRTVKAEYGAELYVFTYAGGETDPPECVTLYPPPGTSWQEAAARATGTQPARLKADGTVRTARGELRLSVEDSDKATIVRVGDCGK